MGARRRLKPTRKVPRHQCVGEEQFIHFCGLEECAGDDCPNARDDLRICCERGYDDALAVVQAATVMNCPACGGISALCVAMGRQWLGEPRFICHCHNGCTEAALEEALPTLDLQPTRMGWSAKCPSCQHDEVEAGLLALPFNDPDADKPTALYRWFDQANLLLYVGISDALADRVKGHVKGSSWMDFAARSTVERYPTRQAALDAEEVAITTEKPLFNYQHNNSPDTQQRLVQYLIKHGRTDLLAASVSRG